MQNNVDDNNTGLSAMLTINAVVLITTSSLGMVTSNTFDFHNNTHNFFTVAVFFMVTGTQILRIIRSSAAENAKGRRLWRVSVHFVFVAMEINNFPTR